ncbi:hypothetical protein O6R16_05225 [Candidatus Rickettsia tasmanensis]
MQVRHCGRLAGVVAWIVLLSYPRRRESSKTYENLFFIGLFYHTM